MMARYENRIADLATILAEPAEPVAWRCEGFVADGTLTILAGRAGSYKTWLGTGLALGVARGNEVAGIRCNKGTAAIVDFEQGPRMSRQRLQQAGVEISPGGVTHIDAGGLDLANVNDLAWLAEELESENFDYVLWDSLKRATPSLGESDNDEMATAVANLAQLARNQNSAHVLITHRGRDNRKLFRGATAIMDQADALFGLVPVGDADEEETDLRRLTCRGEWGKPPRYAEAPEDRYLRLDVEQGGIVGADSPRLTTRRHYETEIRELLPFTGTKKELAEACGTTPQNDSWRAAFEAIEIVKVKGTFTVMPDFNSTVAEP